MPEAEAATLDERIIRTARKQRRMANNGWRSIFDKASDDMQFVYDVGKGQWPVKMREDREKDRRPVITVNKLQKYVTIEFADLPPNYRVRQDPGIFLKVIDALS